MSGKRFISKHEKTILEAIRDLVKKEKELRKEIDFCEKNEKQTFSISRSISRLYRGYKEAHKHDLVFVLKLKNSLIKGLEEVDKHETSD